MEQTAVDYLKTFPQQIFQKGSYIARQGQAVEYIYYLAEGTCVRNSFTPKGDEIIYDERNANKTAYCLIGALTLYCPIIIHQTNFIAKTTCVCYKIHHKDFLAFLSQYPSVLHELLTMSMLSYQKLDANFHAKQKGQAASRVCDFIIRNSKSFKKTYLLDQRFSVSEISRYLGMHRVTVNKIILALYDEGCLIRTENGIEIVNREKLQAYASSEEKLEYKKS